MLRPNPNFRDSSLHRIFNFGIRISGKSESIFQFWDFCESSNKNLAFFNKTLHFRLPNVKIFFHFSTKPRKIFANSCESLANPGSESWKKDSNQSQIMKRDSNPGSRIRFGLNTNKYKLNVNSCRLQFCKRRVVKERNSLLSLENFAD